MYHLEVKIRSREYKNSTPRWVASENYKTITMARKKAYGIFKSVMNGKYAVPSCEIRIFDSKDKFAGRVAWAEYMVKPIPFYESVNRNSYVVKADGSLGKKY